MRKLPIVALIGQTNAGKSSLLNRLARKNIAIVAREEGTTRDNVMARVEGRFLLVDTAGLKEPEDEFEEGIQEQIQDAIEMAEAIVIVMDSAKYVTMRDKDIAKKALKSKKPVLLVLNKSDLGEALGEEEFRGLGVKQMMRTSATTGMNIRELKEAIAGLVTPARRTASEDGAVGGARGRSANGSGADEEIVRRGSDKAKTAREEDGALKIALVGRPNVGKSSLFNALGQKQQALVSSRQGTTRDVNRVEVKFHGERLEILDTAGLRRPGKREVGIEKFSALRTLAAIEEADVVALLVDATEPHSKLDQAIAGQIIEAGKGIIVVLTKTDLVENVDEILDGMERDFNFIPYAPVLVTSSETGKNVTKLFELATEVEETRKQEVRTAELNKILGEAVLEHPPAGLKNTRPKLKYIVQTDTCPPWFVVHGRDLGLLHWSYKRFLERKIREKYPFVGTPIFFSFREDKGE